MSGLETLVQSYFLGLEINDTEFSGYIDGSGEFLRFRDDLRSIGFMFVIRTTAAGSSFLFNHTRKGAKTQVPFFGPLFQISKNLSYECRFGKNRNHASKHSIDVPKKKRSSLPSKKIGCKAMMHVSQLTIYPEFRISEYNSHGSVQQTEVRRQLSEAIAASKKSPPGQASRPPTTVTRYSIAISRECTHSHSLAVAHACQSLHPKLAAEIKRLSLDRNATVTGIRLHLEAFVERMIEETNCIAPNRQNRCYYPTNKVIYQHLHSAIAARKTSEDRIVLEQYLEACNYRSRDLDDVDHKDGALLIDDRTTPDPMDGDEDSVVENKHDPTDISSEGNTAEDPSSKTNSLQMVKVRIMSPSLLSTQTPLKKIVPKLKVLSDEVDVQSVVSSLRTEIWALLDESHDAVLATEDVERLEAAKVHLLAARLALTTAPANKTVSVLLRSASRNAAQRVPPVVIKNRVAFEMESHSEYDSILGV